MIGDEDADPRSAQVRDDFLNVHDGQRIDARKRLVQQNKGRIQHQRTRNFQAAPLAARKRVSPAMSYLFQSHLRQQFF